MTSTVTTPYRLALGLALGTALFLVLAVGALGVVGDGGRADRGYLAVLVVLGAGSVVARLRARGMALVLGATALTQAVVTLVVLLLGLPADEDASVVDLVGITAMFVALFGLSAYLFWRAAGARPASSGYRAGRKRLRISPREGS